MPASRLWRRIHEAITRFEEKERRDNERWVLTTWAQTQGIFHALRFGDELPMTKAEYDKQQKGKKPTSREFKEAEKAREQMLESRKFFQWGILSPQHFGAFLGAEQVLGEPPESFEEFKEQIADEGKVTSISEKQEAKAVKERMFAALDEAEAQGMKLSPEEVS